MDEGWGLGNPCRSDLVSDHPVPLFADGLYPSERLAFPGAVGAPFLSHCLDLTTVFASSDVHQVS